MGAGATSASALKFGGANPPTSSIAATEEFTNEFESTVTLTTS
jgi:hypothetical protein